MSLIERIANDPHSRRRFLALTGGVGISAVLAACGDDEDAAEPTASSTSSTTEQDKPEEPMFGEGDLGIVNYALTLEYLEAAFYEKVVASDLFEGSEQRLLNTILTHEQEHVVTLEEAAAMLGEPVAPPEVEFPLKDAKSVLDLASVFENLGASAYLGQAALVKEKKVLQTALAIHGVEARHAAALNLLTGRSPTPDGSFAVPADMKEVLAEAKPFIVS